MVVKMNQDTAANSTVNHVLEGIEPMKILSLVLNGAWICMLLATSVRAQERIDLESTFIGDKEQPSVSYFVPWKAPEGPSKLYRPIKSISGNVLDPVDRDVLARNIQFYNELSLEGGGGRE
jgi:hypothetical protein